jgi:hypothetical protein
LTVDALGTGALVIDGMVEGALPIQHHAHASPGVPIGVFDTAFAFLVEPSVYLPDTSNLRFG